jgi:hypothetical protein
MASSAGRCARVRSSPRIHLADNAPTALPELRLQRSTLLCCAPVGVDEIDIHTDPFQQPAIRARMVCAQRSPTATRWWLSSAFPAAEHLGSGISSIHQPKATVARPADNRRSPGPPQSHCIALRNGNPAMPRGRHPEGEHTLSNAERQARYRARREADQPAPVVRYRRPVDRRSRLQRWHDAVAGLLALQAECAAWCDVLPDSLREPPLLQPYRPSSISTLMNSPPSCHRVDTVAIDGTW